MKNSKHTIKGFCMGLLTAAVIAGSGLPAMALSNFQQINVAMGGIKLFVDGQLQVPTDVKGNVVEPLIYNGTTYLPVRALTGMLTDKSVAWDAKTESVYIGVKPGAGEVIRADELKAIKGDNFKNGTNAQFDLLDQTVTPFNKLYSTTCTLLLNEGYSTIQGKFVTPYSSLGSQRAGSLKIYSVDRYGVETLIDEYALRAADDPISVSTNIRGCYAIRIRTDGSVLIDDFSGYYGCFYDVTLTTATAK